MAMGGEDSTRVKTAPILTGVTGMGAQVVIYGMRLGLVRRFKIRR